MPDKINQVPKLTGVEGMDPAFALHYSQLTDTVNSLLGYNGEIPLQNHVNMNGKSVRNIGAPITPLDAISSALADQSYSAPVLKPKLQAGGTAQLSSYRMLNSGTQREQLSSYLNDLMSSVPNANGILPTLHASGGFEDVTIPPTIFTFADQSSVQVEGRMDTLSLATTYTITSISAVGGVVTVTVASATGLTAGELMTIADVTPAGFNGAVYITNSSGGGATLQYNADVGTETGSGGQVQLANVYYYAVQKRSSLLFLFGPYNGDTAQNRLQVNYDGHQIVAVVVLNGSGGQLDQSGGGGSPILGSPAAGSFF